MPRSRNIKPGFFKSEELAQCEPLARLLFAALWCEADREGLLLDRPMRLKAEYLPYDNCNCDELLTSLATFGLIVRYEVNGTKYIAIPKFCSHQNPHPDEKAKNYPHPQQAVVPGPTMGRQVASNGPAMGQQVASPIVTRLIPDSLSLDSCNLIPEVPPTEVCTETAEPSVSPPAVVLEFPTEGKGGKRWSLTEAKLAEYEAVYPNLDVMAEMRKALQWCRDNPTKLKTRNGMPAFLTRWLNRAQDKPRAGPLVGVGEVRPALDPSIWSGNE